MWILQEKTHKIHLKSFSNNESIDVDDYSKFRVPRLLNYVPNTKYKSFIKKVNKIDEEILFELV